ncbi:alpha-ketoglutarate-dependent taurine dioxygenase [Xylaria curta]|nr:alpha-ketoglutarate-dependent taurine dioxygenase [Xylaria curta]
MGKEVPIPTRTRQRLEAAGIDLNNGYPHIPENIKYLQDAEKVRSDLSSEFVDRGSLADPEKKALLSVAKEVNHLTTHIGTEIIGLQLKNLNDKQKDELALLIAERGVVFFRDQDISPQQQRALGEYWGPIYPQGAHVPGLPGVSTIWPDFWATTLRKPTYRQPFQGWHTDMVHEKRPPGITHLHHDTCPDFGGDLLWASGYAAYSKLSPDFRKIIDGKQAIYRSGDTFIDRENPEAGPKFIQRTHPMVRVHPATGWRCLYVNRGWTLQIVGLDKKESDLILGYLFDVYENNVDIQVRFKWRPGSSALWDNRITLHTASWDYENGKERHGTRVATLGETPYYDEKAPTRRQALGLHDD